MKRSRLDRYIAHHCNLPIREVQMRLALGRVVVNGVIAKQRQQVVSELDEVQVDGKALNSLAPCYLMLNKPAGVISATQDAQFTTVIDLIPQTLCPNTQGMHYTGRLDRASTGLMLLTNDGKWSRRVAEPERKQPKHYLVTVESSLKTQDIEAFAKGFFFEYENLWTQPAQLEILDEYSARVVITEGKYHQIKRMFARCDNKVVSLHRYQIGSIRMDDSLAVGEMRALTPEEIQSV